MSSALVVVDNVGPVTGLILKCLEQEFAKVLVYHRREARFMNADAPQIPPWASDKESNEFILWIRKVIETESVDSILAQGFESAGFACKFSGIAKVLAVMLPGELDISGRRQGRIRRFKQISQSLNGFIFLNEWEMFKATSLGSKCPHFIWNYAEDSVGIDWNLESTDDGKTVVFFDHIKRGNEVSVESLGLGGLQRRFGSDQIECRPSNSLYWHLDLSIGRKIRNTAQLRTQGISRAIFVDNDSSSLVSLALANPKSKQLVWANSSIEHELLLNAKNAFSIGSEPRIVASLIGEDLHEVSLPILEQPHGSEGRTLSEILSITDGAELPWFFEDFGDIAQLSIFFSVAALENRSNGARPQRIRNMYLAMARKTPIVHLSTNPNTLDRRIPLIKYLVDSGVTVNYFYGENSTNPIRGYDAPLRVTRLLDELAHLCKTKSMYFVRDVHWLDSTLRDDRSGLDQEAVFDGKFELTRFGGSTGALISPSFESSENYARLAAPHFSLSFCDAELPPAISPRNIIAAGPSWAESTRTTFVYTGGVSKLYSMDIYLEALASLNREYDSHFYADFIVRDGERQLLHTWLESVGLANSTNIRVLSGSFDQYVSRTQKNIGILLLDSDYGRKAFAFKAVSYMERMMPFITYSESPNNRYLSRHGISIPVENRTDVYEALEYGLNFDHSNLAWAKIYEEENWDRRWQTVENYSSVKMREKR